MMLVIVSLLIRTESVSVVPEPSPQSAERQSEQYVTEATEESALCDANNSSASDHEDYVAAVPQPSPQSAERQNEQYKMSNMSLRPQIQKSQLCVMQIILQLQIMRIL